MPDANATLPGVALPKGRGMAQRSVPALRTIAALVLREMSTRFGRKPGGYLWALLGPLGIIIMLAFGFSLLARTPALGTSFLLFQATGLLVYQLFRGTSRLVGVSLTYSKSLLIYPGVTWIDAVIARFLLNTTVSVVVMIIILTGVVIYQDISLILDWGMIVSGVALTILLAFGFGVLNAYLSERFEIYDNLYAIATAPLLLASGVVFLYDDLPVLAQEVLWYNPLIHTIGMMRAGFYSVYQPQYLSPGLVVFSALVPMALGLLLLRRYHRELLAD